MHYVVRSSGCYVVGIYMIRASAKYNRRVLPLYAKCMPVDSGLLLYNG